VPRASTEEVVRRGPEPSQLCPHAARAGSVGSEGGADARSLRTQQRA